MKRLSIILIDRRNGVIPGEFIDVQSVLAFLVRTGRARNLQLSAHITGTTRAMFLEKIDVTTLQRDLLEFQNKA
jgi:hypothetical protein